MIYLVWGTILEEFPYLLEGLSTTMSLTIISLFFASVFGLVMAFLRSYNIFPLNHLVYIYEKVFRGIPLLVIFMIVWLGLPEFDINLDAFPAAIVGLILRSTAYQAQIYRSSINSIPRGQMEAAQSIGMSKFQAIKDIILPQVLRVSIPGWSNEFTIVLKDTSIAFAIGVVELMRRGDYIYEGNTNLVLPVLITIAAIYFVVVFMINRGLGLIEKKLEIPGYEVEVER
ncbi:MAG: amino acid ABC transporter permease [Thermoplasmatota archaeon]